MTLEKNSVKSDRNDYIDMMVRNPGLLAMSSLAN